MLYTPALRAAYPLPTPVSRGLRALALLTAVGLTLVTTRGLLTGTWWLFGMLTWNLVLAWFPLGVVLVLGDLLRAGVIGRGLIWPALAGWLLFLPNSPYLITDLFHIRDVSENLLWFDTLTLFLFALTGLLTGLYSTLLVHRLLYALVGTFSAWGLVLACHWAVGFGIFLGRYGRWNSWHLVTKPGLLAGAVQQALQNPLAIQLTLTYGFVLAGLYLAFYFYVRDAAPAVKR